MKTRRQRALEERESSSSEESEPKKRKPTKKEQKQQKAKQAALKKSKRSSKSKSRSKSRSPSPKRSKRSQERRKAAEQQDKGHKRQNRGYWVQTKDQSPKNERKSKRKSKSPSPEVKQDKAKKSKNPDEKDLKKVIVKGAVPVDQYFKNATNVHVLESDGKVYSATLNQTNMEHNNNKYYIIQVIESDNNKSCFMFTRWGRVGEKGQTACIGPTAKEHAIREYDRKYHEKHVKGEYRHLSMNYGDPAETKPQSKEASPEPKQRPEKQRAKDFEQSQLNKQVKDLIMLIFDINMMTKQMKQIGYDAKKMPLGNLSDDNIKHGYAILKKLMEAIRQKDDEDIVKLNNDFFSFIPHDFGRQNMKYFLLDTETKVKQKLEMLQSLTDIKIFTAMQKDNKDDLTNQIDANYARLNRDIKVLKPNSTQHQIIQEYIRNTHGATHRQFQLEIKNIFKLENQNETKRYKKDISNKMLLWHGSRLTNYVGILSQGLRIAPPQAPVTGYMFGKGVYFADMVSKSANYCFTNRENNTGLMLLCEVALGEMNEKTQADPYASNLPPGKLSTKGVGKNFPPQSSYVDLDGIQVPLGKPQSIKDDRRSLLYNEYIVYDVSQVKLKYLLRLKFNYK